MTTPTPSNELLMERMETLIKAFDAFRQDFKEANTTLQRLPVIELQVQTVDGKMTRCFKAVADAELEIKGNSESIIATRTASRILAGASTFAFALLMAFSGWAWAQFSALQANDNAFNIRLNSLEIKALEAEKNADKMTKNGWVRNDK